MAPPPEKPFLQPLPPLSGFIADNAAGTAARKAIDCTASLAIRKAEITIGHPQTGGLETRGL
jgi:hypothetical protein